MTSVTTCSVLFFSWSCESFKVASFSSAWGEILRIHEAVSSSLTVAPNKTMALGISIAVYSRTPVSQMDIEANVVNLVLGTILLKLFPMAI